LTFLFPYVVVACSAASIFFNIVLVICGTDVVEANFDAGVGLVVGVDFMFRMSSASFHSKAVLYIILQLCGTLVCGEAVSLDQVLNR